MSTSSRPASLREKFHSGAYHFVDAALRYTQNSLRKKRQEQHDVEAAESHISGPELLDGIREMALEEFGLMTLTVFNYWGVHSTDDFGRIVFDFIDQGQMKKTDSDKLSDFFDVYDFDEVFGSEYEVDVSHAFRQ
jgi:uncharacterized repeat protein (TIGR04138 family)